MNLLKGITWDHPRGFDSIVASSRLFMTHNPGIKIEWSKRTLKEFGYQPMSLLAKKYDLLMIDHPFVGEGHKNQLFIPLESILPPRFLEKQVSQHIGKCYESYMYQNSLYALPIDASAQFSAFNIRLLDRDSIPVTWGDYVHQGKSFREKIIWPLCPTDLWCSLLTICVQINGSESFFLENGLDFDVFSQGIEQLRLYTDGLNKICFDCNPIRALDLLGSNEYAYSPLLFGYSNYSDSESGISFANAVSIDPGNPVSLLGGAGIAASSFSRYPDDIAKFMTFLFGKDSMDAYFLAGGQPSLREFWQSDLSNNFFKNTSQSMEKAYLRPRFPGFHIFQKKASEVLHERFHSLSTQSLVQKLEDLYLNPGNHFK